MDTMTGYATNTAPHHGAAPPMPQYTPYTQPPQPPAAPGVQSGPYPPYPSWPAQSSQAAPVAAPTPRRSGAVWLQIGIPVVVAVILCAVVGFVFLRPDPPSPPAVDERQELVKDTTPITTTPSSGSSAEAGDLIPASLGDWRLKDMNDLLPPGSTSQVKAMQVAVGRDSSGRLATVIVMKDPSVVHATPSQIADQALASMPGLAGGAPGRVDVHGVQGATVKLTRSPGMPYDVLTVTKPAPDTAVVVFSDTSKSSSSLIEDLTLRSGTAA